MIQPEGRISAKGSQYSVGMTSPTKIKLFQVIKWAGAFRSCVLKACYDLQEETKATTTQYREQDR